MSFDSIYKMSVVMSMIDNISGPMTSAGKGVEDTVSKLDSMSQTFGNLTQLGSVMSSLGREITESAIAPVTATWDTKNALAELSSLGIENLGALENAAEDFSNYWSGTSKAEFVSAAYDIKSGIASLSDEGIADYTTLAGITAKATKSTIAEMTDLFATGYGIYKGFYSDLTDTEFGEIFSAGIAASVRQFKTTGSGMANAIQNLGASATNAQVPLEEQLSVLGMLQATMGGAEAGTKYKSFLATAGKAGKELGLSFLDAENNLKSMPEILDQLQMKFGDTMDAAEKLELKNAFGSDEAVQLIDLLYNKTDELQNNIVGMYGELEGGIGIAAEMADTINNTDPSKYEVLQQKLQNIKETIGNTVQPSVDSFMESAGEMADRLGGWIEEHQTLVSWLLKIVFVLGILLTGLGSVIAIGSGAGLLITKTISAVGLLRSGIGLLSGGLETMQIYALYGMDKIKLLGSAFLSGVGTAKNFALGILSMGKQAIVTAATAMPGIIASVWSFTAALLANPITWIVIAIIALIAALVALYLNWDKVTEFLSGKATAIYETVTGKIQDLKDFFAGLPEWFRESGKKVIETFTEGITSVLSKPGEAVQNALSSVRNLLPFSDAKEGPLSTLTLSGQRLLETVSAGIDMESDLPAERVETALNKIQLSDTGTLALAGNPMGEDSRTEDVGKKIIIQKLLINPDMDKIRDIKRLLQLLDEIEDYIHSSGEAEDDENLVFE